MRHGGKVRFIMSGMQRFLLAFLLGFPVASLAAGEPAHAQKITQDKIIQELIVQLGDPQPARREAATAHLARLGRAAMPQLRLATYHRKHEVRWRAERILGELAPAEAWNEKARRRLKQASVTIQAQDQPLEEVLRDFARQTKLPVALSPHLRQMLKGEALRVRLEVKNYGAELALNRLLDDLKLTCSLVYNALLVEGGSRRRPAMLRRLLDTRVGPFRFKNAPLRSALGEVRAALPAGMAFDAKLFNKETARGYTLNLTTRRPLRLETVLAMTLDGHDLGFVFDGQRLLITSRAKARNTPQTAEYPLRDLVKSLGERLGGDGRKAIAAAIRESVDRRAWGREAKIRWKGRDVLLVRQRRATLARVTSYLQMLQRVEGLLNRDPGEDLEF